MSGTRPYNPFDICQFQYANGHLCGLPCHPKGEGMCLPHFRHTHSTRIAPQEDDLRGELYRVPTDLLTQIDIHHVLSVLFQALGANRISPKRANSLAYIAFLLSQSQKEAKEEVRDWDRNLPLFRKLVASSTAPPTKPSPHPNLPPPSCLPTLSTPLTRPPPTTTLPRAPTPPLPLPTKSPIPQPIPSASPSPHEREPHRESHRPSSRILFVLTPSSKSRALHPAKRLFSWL